MPALFLLGYLLVNSTFLLAQPLDRQGFGTQWPSGHPDRIFIEQLNAMGLHDIAIESTARQRSDSRTTSSINARVHWTMLWMESVSSKIDAQSSRFLDNPEQLDSILADLKSQTISEQATERGAWVEYKAAWSRWWITRGIVATYLASPKRDALQSWALKCIRTGLDEVDAVQSRAAKTATTNAAAKNPDIPTATEISSLIAESKLLGCDFLMLRAQLYLDNQEEQVAVGTQILSLLDEAEKRIGANWDEYPKIDVARGQAWLYLAQPDKTLEIVKKHFDAPNVDHARWDVAFANIGAEACYDKQDYNQASNWIEKGGGRKGSAELALIHFSIELAKLAPNDQEGFAKLLQNKKEISEWFGSYWANRADALLIASKHKDAPKNGSGVANGNAPTGEVPMGNSIALEILRSEVKQLLAGKKWSEAITKLQQAELAAATQKDTEGAIQFAMQAAALWGIQKDFSTAADEFHRASLAYESSQLAPKAAMNAIAMIQQAIQGAKGVASSPPGENSRDGGSGDSKVDEKLALEMLIATRTQIWLDAASRWPGTEQSLAATSALTDFYIATDRIFDLCDLWIRQWESQKEDKNKNSIVSEDRTSEVSKLYAATRCMESYRLIAWLQNQRWLDASLESKEGGERLERIQSRIHVLVQQSNSPKWMREEKDIQSMQNEAGWEYVELSDDFQFEKAEWYTQWVALQIHSMKLFQSTKPTREDHARLIDWSETLKGRSNALSIPNCKLKRMVDRTLAFVELQRQSVENESSRPEIVRAIRANEAADPRSPWWKYYGARLVQSWQGGIQDAELAYRQLAAGLPPGSEGWLECRARTCETLRASGKTEEANKLAQLVAATQLNLSPRWRIRFGLE